MNFLVEASLTSLWFGLSSEAPKVPCASPAEGSTLSYTLDVLIYTL